MTQTAAWIADGIAGTALVLSAGTAYVSVRGSERQKRRQEAEKVRVWFDGRLLSAQDHPPLGRTTWTMRASNEALSDIRLLNVRVRINGFVQPSFSVDLLRPDSRAEKSLFEADNDMGDAEPLLEFKYEFLDAYDQWWFRPPNGALKRARRSMGDW